MKTKETLFENQLNDKVDGVKLKTTREQAIDWWKKLKYDSPEHLEYYAKKYFKKNWDSLTAKEVEEIWLIKTFDESLFKAYIDKFSKDDKFKALKILWDELNVTEELNETLNNH